MSVIDSYSEINYDLDSKLPDNGGTFSRYAQGFTGKGSVVSDAKFYLGKTGTPTGNAFATIYASTGTYGVSAIPTGAALATSDAFDVSTLTGSDQLITFTFTGVNQISLTSGAKYFLALEYTGGTPTTSFINHGIDSTSPSASGNRAQYTTGSGVWTGDNLADFIFYVNDALPVRSEPGNIGRYVQAGNGQSTSGVAN